MRWRTREITAGTKRGRWKFAWLPVKCCYNITVWLEPYYLEEIYDPPAHPDGGPLSDWRLVNAYPSTVNEGGGLSPMKAGNAETSTPRRTKDPSH